MLRHMPSACQEIRPASTPDPNVTTSEPFVEMPREPDALAMPFKHSAADFGLKMMNRVHRAVLFVSRGRFGRQLMGMQSVELHTTGRKSGQRRSVLLTAPIHDESRTVLVASKGGDDRDPEWYKNLVAQPDVEVTIDGTTRRMHARTASPEEKAELWPQIVKAYKGYAGYQKRTTRDIPLVICEPA
jgi:deazaflavin-dependent oxidoreductase (nitroreductase family)